MVGFIITVIVLVIFIGGCIMGRYWEKKQWNNGSCSECGRDWIWFDQDSQGGRGYKCKCNRVIWVSWGVDERNK